MLRIRPLGDSRGDDGAALIEFALFLPILLMVLVGTVTGGVAFARAHSLDNAAREGARFGATLPVNGDLTTWLNDVAAVAQAAATGDLEDGLSGREICVAYVYPDGTGAADQTMSLTIDEAGTPSTAAAWCFDDGRPPTDRRVQVATQRSSFFNAIFFQRDLTLTGRSAAQFERVG